MERFGMAKVPPWVGAGRCAFGLQFYRAPRVNAYEWAAAQQ